VTEPFKLPSYLDLAKALAQKETKLAKLKKWAEYYRDNSVETSDEESDDYWRGADNAQKYMAARVVNVIDANEEEGA
jgi:hypothetical protein